MFVLNLFAEDIVLNDEIRPGTNNILKLWRETLAFKDLKLSRIKLNIQCKFRSIKQKSNALTTITSEKNKTNKSLSLYEMDYPYNNGETEEHITKNLKQIH